MVSVPDLDARLPRLLSGDALDWRPEPLTSHRARFGPLPSGGKGLIDELEAAGLRGRGGAAFPAAIKWRAVADRSNRRGIVVVNGAEGEPLSLKDHLLLASRPHLVLDGAQLAAESVGAREVILYVGRHHGAAFRSLETALQERRGLQRLGFEVAAAPPRFVAGEETAAIRFLNGGEAKPAGVPPRPFERGVRGRPTLVNNVETLAQAALIARYGAGWFRSVGSEVSPGSTLVTAAGQLARPGVHEVEARTRLRDVTAPRGGAAAGPLLVGGYFGSWVSAAEAADLTFDCQDLAAHDLKLGAGVVFALPPSACGVAATARILDYLAAESARQCGPCQFGLADLALLLDQLARGRGRGVEPGRLQRWLGQLAPGRGACHHPDGAVGMVKSALRVFAEDFEVHLHRGACAAAFHDPGLPIARREAEAWR